MDAIDFGKALARERARANMSNVELAEAVGISTEEYNAIERGEQEPQILLADKLARALGVTLDTLMSSGYVPPIRMGKEEEIDPDEKKREWAAYEARQAKTVQSGRKILLGLIIFEVIMLVVGFFSNNLITTVFSLIMLFALWRGKKWARYVYTILQIISIIIGVIALPGVFFTGLPFFAILITIIYSVIAILIVCVSYSVNEFLAEQSGKY